MRDGGTQKPMPIVWQISGATSQPQPDFEIEVTLRPQHLSCDATEALTRCLAEAVAAIANEGTIDEPSGDTWTRRALELLKDDSITLP